MHAVDFVNDGDGSCNLINNWVANETNGMIEELIPPGGLSKQTRLVLTNAIYFKGSWAAPFQAQATENQPFQLTSSEQATVPMMHATGEYGYMANDAIQALKLPYASGELSMIVLLPQAFDGLSDFEQTLTPATLAATLATFQNQTVAVSLPKFSLTTQFDATSIPEAMGMTAAFSTEANFSGITKSGGLFLSKVMHKAVIDVDEEGSVAAGATGIIAVTAVAIANPLSPIVFLANHPFLFLIRHEPTGTILFMGRLAEPAP
jgi:serpin B